MNQKPDLLTASDSNLNAAHSEETDSALNDLTVVVRVPNLDALKRGQEVREDSSRYLTPSRRTEFAAAHTPHTTQPRDDEDPKELVVLHLLEAGPNSSELTASRMLFDAPTRPGLTRRRQERRNNAMPIALMALCFAVLGYVVHQQLF
jgi:hypothetical protein